MEIPMPIEFSKCVKCVICRWASQIRRSVCALVHMPAYPILHFIQSNITLAVLSSKTRRRVCGLALVWEDPHKSRSVQGAQGEGHLGLRADLYVYIILYMYTILSISIIYNHIDSYCIYASHCEPIFLSVLRNLKDLRGWLFQRRSWCWCPGLHRWPQMEDAIASLSDVLHVLSSE